MIMVARGEQGRIWRLDTDTGALRDQGADHPSDAGRCGCRCRLSGGRARDRRGAYAATYPHGWLARSLLMLLSIRSGLRVGRCAGHGSQPRPGGGRRDIGRHSSGALCAGASAHWLVHRAGRGAAMDRSCCEESKAADAPFAEALDAEISELLRLEALIEPPTNLQSCHRDLWADNILPTPTGGVCVIDWENCGLADPAQELPMAMIDFASR